jgi:hypothetical protein
VAGAHLAPDLPAVPPPPGLRPARAPAAAGQDAGGRAPSEIGGMLSRYRRGLEQGRYDLEQGREREPDPAGPERNGNRHD